MMQMLTMQTGAALASRSDWTVLRPLLAQSVVQTLQMVLVTIVIGGALGLVLGVILYGTRPGNLFENRVVYRILDILVNIIRPIPFIIFLAAMQPLTIKVVGTSIGTTAAIFPMVVMCTFATSRLVEQNLVPVDHGVIEAARAMGASKLTIIRTVLIPKRSPRSSWHTRSCSSACSTCRPWPATSAVAASATSPSPMATRSSTRPSHGRP